MKPLVLSAEPSQTSFEDGAFLQGIREQMVKFATLQLKDSHQAEDAVQEALMGAMKNQSSFSGRSAFKTWVFAILRNKIVDILRKKQRLNEVSVDEQDSNVEGLFDQQGSWHEQQKPRKWGDPESNFDQDQFWRVLETCLDHLPGPQAKVFMMREYLGFDAADICQEMAITPSNLHVLLHRARLRLNKCLTINWFEGSKHA